LCVSQRAIFLQKHVRSNIGQVAEIKEQTFYYGCCRACSLVNKQPWASANCSNHGRVQDYHPSRDYKSRFTQAPSPSAPTWTTGMVRVGEACGT
jgi:hypothetical protein